MSKPSGQRKRKLQRCEAQEGIRKEAVRRNAGKLDGRSLWEWAGKRGEEPAACGGGGPVKQGPAGPASAGQGAGRQGHAKAGRKAVAAATKSLGRDPGK